MLSNIKKKLTITAVLILLTILVIVIIITFSPKKIHINAQGIKYRLGTEHLKSEEPVNVRIEGKLCTEKWMMQP